MTPETKDFFETKSGYAVPLSIRETLGSPDDVLHHPNISVAEKRALLASWASDVRAVPGVPILRQWDNGSVAIIDDILRALSALDGEQPDEDLRCRFDMAKRAPFARRPHKKWISWVRRRGRDDDDPPPCPVRARLPHNNGGGAIVWAEPALV
ncbi:hypothetical protein [Mesorhizobium helmanticense]|uniref:Uncharacterized protein n=1 Tax=Mesorhizobium helmanticense TaxID=1776423 RepID=A0A2T4J2J9_9HYPH|nr:hypothetical protein [Mesorhizobium helmanticense]PTE12119.1 hypothetical protein C9427_02140 [Mesorhizobium helmanticense]